MKRYKCTDCSDAPCYLETPDADYKPESCPWVRGGEVVKWIDVDAPEGE